MHVAHLLEMMVTFYIFSEVAENKQKQCICDIKSMSSVFQLISTLISPRWLIQTEHSFLTAQ